MSLKTPALPLAISSTALSLSWRSDNPKMAVLPRESNRIINRTAEASPHRLALRNREGAFSERALQKQNLHLQKPYPKESAHMTVEAHKSQDLKETQESG